MEIIIAKNSGLCYGVKRAIQIAKETLSEEKGKVFTLGDLIHNPQVIADLEQQGIRSLEDLDCLTEGTVIIRSHGVSPEIYKKIEEKNIKIVDATCPIVKRIQRLVEALAQDEEEIVIVGNKNHPESRGLIGYSQGKGIIIESESQAQKMPKKKRRAVLVQSTQDMNLFQNVVALLIEKTEELKIFNTICQSTQTRQKSTSELASRVDTLFIIGGKNSSNTHKLYQISKRVLPNTHFIESSAQITSEMLKGAKKIGLSGGASTPPEAIEEAVARIKSYFEQQIHREKIVQCQS
ncbi:MAG: 4-hydroxy-3-methylbut-2-enyl diphosphate reductase [Candidatus Aminicenantes bacterium]|jgi:4-hydroxy-3-methylbut-2-enyl diphosphate reductase